MVLAVACESVRLIDGELEWLFRRFCYEQSTVRREPLVLMIDVAGLHLSRGRVEFKLGSRRAAVVLWKREQVRCGENPWVAGPGCPQLCIPCRPSVFYCIFFLSFLTENRAKRSCFPWGGIFLLFNC